jgi:MFS family permease
MEDPSDDASMSSMRRYVWTAAIFLFVAFEAVTMQMRGPLLTSFQATFSVQESLLGLITPAATLGFILTLLAVGFKTGRLNVKRFLLLATIGTALTTILVSYAPSFPVLLLFLCFQGGTAGIFRALDRPILSHLYPVGRGRIFTLYTLLWAIGATTAPLYVNHMIATEDWRLAYLVLGFVFILPFLLLMKLPTPSELGNEEHLSPAAFRDLLANPAVQAMGLGLVLSGGIEGALFTWLPFYAEQFFTTQRANRLLSLYFVAYIPGRFAITYLISRHDHLRLICVLVSAAIPVFLVFVAYTNLLFVASVGILGFLIAGFFPILLAIGVEAAPQHSGPINAIATVANFTGITIVPLVIGILVGFRSINAGIILPLGLLLLLLANILWFDGTIQDRPAIWPS